MANEDKKDFNAITAGIFVSIAAWASYQRTEEDTLLFKKVERT